MSRRIIYQTPADGFGDNASDADRWDFCEHVERRVEEVYPGYTCTATWGEVLASKVRIEWADGDAPDPRELEAWIGNELWDEWCAEAGAQ